MGRVVVFMSLTLDGVMQSPGRPDEDTRGGFEHGGWGVRYADSVSGSMVGRYAGTTEGLLLGRRTYEDFFQVWPNRTDNPFTEALNKAQKYVASRTLSEPLPWVNSTLLKGDALRSVAELKHRLDKDLMVLGSGELVRSLMSAALVDEYILLIHPLVLGSGQRLFDAGISASLRLQEVNPTTTGVLIATYRPEVSGG
ncbi:MAG: dihydrofolate reductase [Chloroflexi bacterium]|nr:MAG: dihydrofolate reductase [Chloroflexota bacterium]